MKSLIIFRGDYSYVTTPEVVCKNLLKYIVSPMREKNHVIDVIFCTYQSNLDKLKIYEEFLNPIGIHFTETGQINNFKASLQIVKDTYEKNIYDHILFLRFDVIYKINIDDWNIFNNDGITFPFKEDTIELFNSYKYYSDIIIILSNSIFLDVANFLINTNNQAYRPPNCLHNIFQIVQSNNNTIRVHTILDGYYQSNTMLTPNDPRLSPLHIQVKYEYRGKDKDLYFIN